MIALSPSCLHILSNAFCSIASPKQTPPCALPRVPSEHLKLRLVRSIALPTIESHRRGRTVALLSIETMHLV